MELTERLRQWMPRRLRTAAVRYQTTRRDLHMLLVDGLLGRHPPPLIQRPPSRYPANPARASSIPRSIPRAAVAVEHPNPASVQTFATGRQLGGNIDSYARKLRICELVHETAHAVSLRLEDPSGAPIEFLPGQFFSVLVDIDGQVHRRAYSASSDYARRDSVRLTVKELPGGRVSGYICRQLKIGDTVRVLGPAGNFVYQPDPAMSRHLVLIGGGSGITPLIAIARAALNEEPYTRVSLLYGNRSVDDIIFADELARMATEAQGRLHIIHALETPPPGWQGVKGRLDRDTLDAVLSDVLLDKGDDQDTGYYLCGPTPMLEGARDLLRQRGVPDSTIYEERYTQPELREPGRNQGDFTNNIAHVAHIDDGSGPREVVVSPGQTILDAGLAAGIPMRFSCAMGGCGACRVKLTAGHVAMEEPNCLSEREREDGHILACVSRPTSAINIDAGEDDLLS